MTDRRPIPLVPCHPYLIHSAISPSSKHSFILHMHLILGLLLLISPATLCSFFGHFSVLHALHKLCPDHFSTFFLTDHITPVSTTPCLCTHSLDYLSLRITHYDLSFNHSPFLTTLITLWKMVYFQCLMACLWHRPPTVYLCLHAKSCQS